MRSELCISKFFVTINSQANDSTVESRKKQAIFKKAIEKMFLSTNILNFLQVRNQSDDELYSKKDLIYDITVETVFEVGSKQGRLHTHSTITVRHFSTFGMYSKKIIDYFAVKSHISVYAKATWVRSNDVMAVRYLMKGQKRSKKRFEIKSTLRYLDGKERVFEDKRGM